MSYYVIGIGGTGAKCVEALTHLCAAGLMPDGELYVVFVDPDRANGSLGRAEITLQQYVNCQQLELGSTDLFKTRITIAKPDVWSPFGDEPKPRLDNFFLYSHLKETRPEVANLFDVLYSKEEKETRLEEGFRGHPSIGAAVMATTIQLGEGDPWETFRDKIALDLGAKKGAKIILIGSIFGGTGASGIPTIARLIRQELKKLGEEADHRKSRLGAVLMLPYFSFNPVKEATLKADSENFLLSTQAALKYYSQQNYLDTYDAVYVLGDDSMTPLGESSIGGRTQNNEPHFAELYAALACIDFFSKDDAKGFPMIARETASQVVWKDMPYEKGPDVLQQKIERLARFAFAYLNSYYPALEHIKAHGDGFRAPWYIDLFGRKGVSLSEALQLQLPHLREFCESFLIWLANIQTSNMELVSLVNYHAFASREREGERDITLLKDPSEFRVGDFGKLTLPQVVKRPLSLDSLWERMCDTVVSDDKADGVGRFVHALFEESMED